MKALIALSAYERDNFLSASLEQKLNNLLPQGRRFCTDTQRDFWYETLRQTNPEIVVGAWGMPSLDEQALALCPGLRYLCYLTGSVRSKIDREFLVKGGVVSNWGATISPTVAECALMLTLDCLRQVTRYTFELHVDRSWRGAGRPVPQSLFGRTVGVHGFGNVARALVPLLRPFGCKVEFWSQPVPPEVFAAAGVQRADSLESVFDNDIVIEAEALTPDSRGSVNWELLRRLRPSAIFVNVARAAIVDEASLIRLAKEDKVQIGLDVYHVEPLPADYPLRGLRNVTMVPHIGGPTIDCYGQCMQHALDNIARYLTGEAPQGAFSVESYDLSPEFF